MAYMKPITVYIWSSTEQCENTAALQSLSRVQLFSTPQTEARQASFSFTIFLSLLQLVSIESMMPSNHLILCRPLLLLLPSIFPSIKALSNESVLCLRWPKYWRFSISPSDEYSGNTAASGIFRERASLVSSFTMIKAYVISSLLLIYSR